MTTPFTLPKLQSPEEYEERSKALDQDESLYGKGEIAGWEICLEFDVTGDSDMSKWDLGTNFFRAYLEEERGWNNWAAGTGFGARDMQFIRATPMTTTELDDMIGRAENAGIPLLFVVQHGINEWGEQAESELDSDNCYEWRKPT